MRSNRDAVRKAREAHLIHKGNKLGTLSNDDDDDSENVGKK